MASFDQLVDTNTRGNSFEYVPEVVEDWFPDTEGGKDCDSVATWKYRDLVAKGWPKSALRLATCWVETGGYHAVLLAECEGQTWVLDNRHPHPMEYDMLPYKFDKLQIAGTQEWEQA